MCSPRKRTGKSSSETNGVPFKANGETFTANGEPFTANGVPFTANGVPAETKDAELPTRKPAAAEDPNVKTDSESDGIREENITKVVDIMKKSQRSVTKKSKEDQSVDDTSTESVVDLLAAMDENLRNRAFDKIAEMVKDLSVEEICDMFGIENDFTPEEEKMNRREFGWAFEM